MKIVEHGAVHRDDRQFEIDVGQDFSDCCGGLLCLNAKPHTLIKKTVQLYFGKGGELAVFAEQDRINT